VGAGLSPGWVEWSVLARPAPGETSCGDGHLVRSGEDRVLAAVVDGLGHGPQAAAAAQAAVRTLEASASWEPQALLEELHRDLAGTRGAAVSVAGLEASGQLTWAGVGNVEAVAVGPDGRTRRLQTGNGIVGQRMGSVRPQRLTVEVGTTLLMVTDGVGPDFLDGCPLLLPVARLPAHILQAEAPSGDDALVLALRFFPSGRAAP